MQTFHTLFLELQNLQRENNIISIFFLKNKISLIRKLVAFTTLVRIVVLVMQYPWNYNLNWMILTIRALKNTCNENSTITTIGYLCHASLWPSFEYFTPSIPWCKMLNLSLLDYVVSTMLSYLSVSNWAFYCKSLSSLIKFLSNKLPFALIAYR